MRTARTYKAQTLHARLARGAALFALAAAAATAQAQVSLRTVVELAQSHSVNVKLAQADLLKAESGLLQSRDAFVPSLTFGSGLPAFPEVGFTGSLPTIWDANVQSMVFSLPQIRYIQAAKMGVKAARLGLADAKEQVALDASTAYIELDTINQELAAAHEQESYARRMVEIEQQRVDGGVDPKTNLLQAQLAAAEIKLHRLHLETRAATLNKQLSTLTGLPVGSIIVSHDTIPEIPAVTADQPARRTPGLEAAEMLANSRERVQKGDAERTRLLPELAFGAQYNRNTTLLNNIDLYYKTPLPADNFSTGFSIRLPIFNFEDRDKVKESGAEALRARVEAEQAEQQNDIQIAQLSGSLRELDALAEIAKLKQEIAAEQLETIASQLELGNGASSGANAQPQLSPEAQQQARVDERQKFIDALDAGFELEKARLNLLRALGHMQDWLNEFQVK